MREMYGFRNRGLVRGLLISVTVLAGAVGVFGQSELRPEAPVVSRLHHDSQVVHTVSMARGHVASITVDHRSTTVQALIFSPKGTKVSSKIAPTLWNGSTEIFFRAAETGRYRVTIATERPGRTSGEVTVTLRERRPFVEPDSSRLAAHEALRSADELRTQLLNLNAVGIKRNRAEAAYEEAVSLFNRLGDKRGEAEALLRFGNFLYEEKDDFPKAEEFLKRSTLLYTELGDVTGLAYAKISTIFPIFYSRGRVPEVDALIAESEELVKRLGDVGLEGRLCVVHGRISLNTGSVPKAIELINRQAEIAGSLDYEGRQFGEFTMLSVATASGDERLKQVYLNSAIATYNANRGKIHPRYVIYPLYQRAMTLKDSGSVSKAEATLLEIISLSEKRDRDRQLAYYLREAGEFYTQQRRFAPARRYLTKSLDIYEKVSPYEAQGIYNSLGVFHLAVGEPGKARDLFRKAVAKNNANGDRYAEANSYANLALAEMALEDFESALGAIDSAFALGMRHLGGLYTRSTRGVFSTWILRNFSEIKISILFRLHERTRDAKYLDEAFQTQERVHARMLLEGVLGSGYEIDSAIDPGVIARRNTVLEEISRLENRLRRNPSAAVTADDELTKLLLQYERIEDELRKLDPRSEAFSNPRAVSISEVRDVIDDDTAVVEYSLGDKESFVWVISGNGASIHRLPKKSEVNALAKSYSDALSGRAMLPGPEFKRIQRRLTEAVLAPIKNEISGFRRLVVVPDEGLTSISFSSLPVTASKPTSLIETHEIVSVPSVSTLLALRTTKRTAVAFEWSRLVAVMADPVFDPSDERLPKSNTNGTNRGGNGSLQRALPDFRIRLLNRLPFTNVEARRISDIAEGRSAVFSGPEASRERLIKGDLSDYRILHFATHGFLNNVHPELSGIVLSLYDSERRPQDGFLRAIDLYSLKLNADLVVLSGCRTADGKSVRSEGIIGVTRGFMYAGVPTIVASLWEIDDSATAYFMEYFYDALLKKGMTPSGALRDAKLRFIASPRFSSPKYWAGFTIQGEYDIYFK
jgi:CHAT domain-containing protein